MATTESTARNGHERTTGERALRSVIFVVGFVLTAYTLYYAYSRPFVRVRHSNIFLGAGVGLFYLYEALKHTYGTDDEAAYDERDREHDGRFGFLSRALGRYDGVVCLLSAVAVAGVALYVETNFDRLLYDAPVLGYTNQDAIVGVLIVALVTDATRRAYGWAITSVVFAAIGYAMAGPWLPGFLGHTGMGWQDVARYGAVGLSGTYGFILGVGTTWVAIFIMFAGIAKTYGALDYILDVGTEFGNKLRSGVVQVAVISSMAMGSITGSAAANTATTGSFTIPMMKRQGVREDFSAAIESVASSGGQMMPPVMGVAAFIMADILQVPYVRIIQAGLLPALLFYLSVGVAVQFVVLKFGWTTEQTGEFDRSVLRSGAHFAIPMAVLVYALVVARLTPLSAGLYTTTTLVVTMYLRDLVTNGLEPKTMVETTVKTARGFRDGAVDMAPLVAVLASMGVIISMLTQTGLAQKISIRMVGLAGGVLIAVLVMAMLLSILFGLGMPTPAAYILVVILVAPGIIEVGIPDITAHLFVFYFAMLSAITPPVAVAVAVGAQIAGSDFLQSCKQALRIGAPGFFIPFAFVANDSIILWSFPETVLSVLVVLAGTVSLVVATVGYDGAQDIGWPHRIVYLALATAAMFAPQRLVQVVAMGLIVGALALTNTGRLPAVIAPSRR